ncbi:hypothetical protein GCM10009422_13760 [Brevundimonas kwangchunensis]|uniref:Uncharacterized protein n=1 Tax=Brevundimonas kwangchunensis TaxID=322163 RepID=A0ABN1GU13_9CAUL
MIITAMAVNTGANGWPKTDWGDAAARAVAARASGVWAVVLGSSARLIVMIGSGNAESLTVSYGPAS